MSHKKILIIAVVTLIILIGYSFLPYNEGSEPGSKQNNRGNQVGDVLDETSEPEGAGPTETSEGPESESKGSEEKPEPENLVEITSRGRFSPGEIEISIRERVYFKNNDNSVHTVLAPSRAWSVKLSPGEISERPPRFYEAQKGRNVFMLKENNKVRGTIIVG